MNSESEEKRAELKMNEHYPLDVCVVSGEPLGSMGEPYIFDHEGREVRLCCKGCLKKFQEDPEKYLAKLDAADSEEHHCCHHCAEKTEDVAQEHQPARKYFCPMCEGVESDEPGDCPMCGMALERNPSWKPAGKTIYTCPMHPEIQQDHPGDCPKCGMALEPMSAPAGGEEEEENVELKDMTRRLWIGAPLALIVMVLSMGGMIPGMEFLHGHISRWAQFILSGVVVLWAGWPFFERGGRSLKSRT